jgi:hypothetical protein
MSPWEGRERGGRYYTSSRKEGVRVVREYIGRGPQGELAARMDAEKRQKHQREGAPQKAAQERMEALMALVDELCEATEVIARATLIACGYHQHNRGEWRKRCEKNS